MEARKATGDLRTALVLGLILGWGVWGLSAPATAGADLSDLRAAEKRTRDAAERVVAATVCIVRGGASGSGVIVREDGLILTAAHVISSPGTECTVTLADGRRARAKALGCEPARDAGMVRITDAGKWPFVAMGRSAGLKLGQWCLATGHPGGLVAGRKPPVRLGRILANGKGETLHSGIITDATVCPGDSGGPLFDLDGKVIGIHTNIGLRPTENRHVPIDVFRRQWDDLVQGKVIGGGKQAGVIDATSIARFQQLLLDRIKAGDPEALALMKDGAVAVTPQKMAELVKKWEKAGGDKKPAEGDKGKKTSGSGGRARAMDNAVPDLFELLKKHGKPGPDGSWKLELTPEQAPEVLRRLMELGALGGAIGGSGDLKLGKAHPDLLAQFGPITSRVGRSTMSVLCDGKAAALGTVVRKDGYILTKASELKGRVTCKVGERELPAVVVSQSKQHDLALLHVQADDLVPVEWSVGKEPPLGAWLVTPDAGGKPLGVGVLGHPSRPITRNGGFASRRAVLGVALDPGAKEATIQQVAPDGPAQQAGLRPGDVIRAVAGQTAPDANAVIEKLSSCKPGDKVQLGVRRDGKEIPVPVTLGAPEKLAEVRAPHVMEAISQLSGGSVSKRKDDFPGAFTHDTVLQASQCGGPVLSLDGRAVGLNLARADRSATYALAAAALEQVIADLLAGAKKP